MDEIAIIGGGQAAAALAARLRHKGFDGGITIYGEETSPPYQRPPLSKKYLSGDWDAERLWLRPSSFWQDQGIELRLGGAVTAVDTASGTLTWNGEPRHWSKLAFVTGAAPRPLPSGFSGRSNAYELRTLADVDRLRPAFLPGRRLVVVGGGYIGLETAAVAAGAGLSVTVIERASRILERVACIETADSIRTLHESHGVRILEGCDVVTAHGNNDVIGVELSDGRVIPGELAVVGVGVLPRTSVAEAAGIACANGISVDSFGRTSAPNVWAAGDCASFELGGLQTRLESVQNAIDQAESAADDMLGDGRPYRPVPWFWSDQYDVKLQIVGLNRGYDAVASLTSARGGSHWYFRDERLVAVDALNDGRAYMAAKKALEAGASISLAEVQSPDFSPMQLARS